MGRPKSTGENKTHQQHLLMTPSEVAAIDDWMFAHRIKSRGEAIRRLCRMAMTIEPAFDKPMNEATQLANEFRVAGAALELELRESGSAEMIGFADTLGKHNWAYQKKAEDVALDLLTIGAEIDPLRWQADTPAALIASKTLSDMIGKIDLSTREGIRQLSDLLAEVERARTFAPGVPARQDPAKTQD